MKGQVKFYKASGAAQFSILPPRTTPDGYMEKEGAILLEVAPGTGRGRDLSWDWSRKITFAISPADIMAMMDQEEPDLFHQSKGVPKKLRVQLGKNSGWFLSIAMGKGDSRVNVSLPLTDGEWAMMRKSFVQMFPYLIGWLS